MASFRLRALALLTSCLAGCGLLIDIGPASDAAVFGLDAGTSDSGALDSGAIDAGLDPGEDAGPPAVCGDGKIDPGEQCDDGNDVPGDGCENDCALSCEDHSECGDDDPCSVDRCVAGACEHVVAPCVEPDACHVFLGCDEGGACVFEQIDEDGDGWSPAHLGACGGDCNDVDEDLNPDVLEVCDGFDQDCDGAIDEGSGTVCSVDLDGDGYGASASRFVECDSECPDGFIDDGSDCWDESGEFFPPPFVANPSTTAWFSEPRGDGSGSFDWNCDGVEEARYTNTFVSCSGAAGECAPQGGWGAMGVGRCGERLEYIYCMAIGMGECDTVRGMSDQVCR